MGGGGCVQEESGLAETEGFCPWGGSVRGGSVRGGSVQGLSDYRKDRPSGLKGSSSAVMQEM